MKRLLALAALAASLCACTRLTPEQQVVSDAATALGGRERVLAVKTLVLEGGGTQYNIGQGIEGVAADRTLSDGTMTVVLSPLSSEHSATMLIAWFPRERLLVEADQYTPATPVQMYAAAFLDELKKRKWNVDRIVPLHGTVAPYSQLVKEVGAQQAPAATPRS